MRLTTLTIATIATTTASAQLLDIGSLLSSLAPASGNDPRFTDFQAPGPNDGTSPTHTPRQIPSTYTFPPVRSPCPGLNALANHNFIHRSGRNMTIPHLLKGLAAGMNMGADFTTVVGGAGLLASADPASGAFDLNDLNQHNFPVEHDASASRQDEFFGNYVDFYQPSWDMVLDAYAGREQTDIETAAGALYVRYNDSVTRNPEFVMGLREFTFRFGETAIYIQTMGDPVCQIKGFSAETRGL